MCNVSVPGTHRAIITLLLCNPGLWRSNHILLSATGDCEAKFIINHLVDRNQIHLLHCKIPTKMKLHIFLSATPYTLLSESLALCLGKNAFRKY